MISGEKRGCASRDVIGQWRTISLQLLILVFVLGSLVQDAQGYHTSGMCVQLGQAGHHVDAKFWFTSYTDSQRKGPWTIGTRKFDIKYQFLDLYYYWRDGFDVKPKNFLCPYKSRDHYDGIEGKYCTSTDSPGDNAGRCGVAIEPCIDDTVVELRTYAVMQDGKVLNGWLHFEFELKDPDDKMLAIYVQVRDEFYNAIGEFVSDPREQCKPSNPELTQPTEYQILPCSAVGYREAKVANAVFMAEKHIYRNVSLAEKYIPDKNISRGIHFTWRLNEYWCNRHLRFRPEATILTQKMINKTGGDIHTKPLVMRKAPSYWLRPQWYGAADIKKENTNLSCTDRVIDYSTGKVNVTVAPWIYEDGIRSTFENDYFNFKQLFLDDAPGILAGTYGIKSCQWNVRYYYEEYPYVEPFHKDIGPTFAGRCTHHYKKTPTHDALQGCNLDKNNDAPEYEGFRHNFTIYSTYVQNLTKNRIELCSIPCRVPTPADIKDIKNFTDRFGESGYSESSKYNSKSRNESRTEKLLVGRKYHATLCVIWAMFLTPLGIFCARYFKETCMNVTCSGAHFWFWVHVATAVAASAMFVSSLSGIWFNLETWGRNEDPGGNWHRAVGYLSASLFFLMMVLGAFRPLQRKMRIVMMTVHSFLGFLIYICNVLAMVLSFFIPASPTIGDCDEMGFSTKMSDAIYPIAIWVGIDMFLHIVMTVFQLMKDRSVGLRRPWYCPIIPILPHDSADDFVGSSLRKITLLIYGGAAFILTSVTIGLLQGSNVPPMHCQNLTGRSSCDQPWGCSATALSFARKVQRSKNSTSGTYIAGDF